MNFESIAKANATIQTTEIKGKDYAEVNQRIKAFRMVYPTGCIYTNMLSNEGGLCVFKAIASYTDENGEHVLGTGHAFESQSSSFINKTSYIENCETSAVGRALGMCGFGIDTSVCSAEELANAMMNQKKPAEKPKNAPVSADVSENAVLCKKCGEPILREKNKHTGEWIPPERVAEYCKGMCKSCFEKEKEAKQ